MAASNKNSSRAKFESAKSKILESIDVRAEYANVGLRFPANASVRESGWIQAYAIDRPDSKPSAAIHVETGCYKDSGGTGRTLSFWDAMSEFGRHGGWLGAMRHFAKQENVKLPKSYDETALDQVEIVGPITAIKVHKFLKKNPHISIEDLKSCGCQIARYPKKSSSPFYCIAWPFYGPKLADSPPRGYVLQSVDGNNIEGSRGESQKRLSIGVNSGLSNRESIELIASRKANVVIKVEGYSDMMSLISIIPEEDRKSVAVTTNACGAHESTLPIEIASVFKNSHLVIIHDGDEPGQEGAKKWIAATKPHSKSVKNVQLYSKIEIKKGPDLKDWISNGGTWDKLKEIINSTDSIKEAEKVESPAEQICKRLGITVYGIVDRDTGRTQIFDGMNRPRTVIPRQFNEFDLRQCVAPEVIAKEMNLGTEENTPGRLNIKQVAYAIAELSYNNHISENSFRGDGIWKSGEDELTIVQSREVFKWNGTGKLEPGNFCEGETVYDVGSSKKWLNIEHLKQFIQQSQQDPNFNANSINESIELFSRWDNWKDQDSPELIAGLIACTFIQTVLPIRPMVGISGQSNTGKSWFASTFQGIFGSELAKTTTDASEAAVRNLLGNTAKILYLDEFEDKKSREGTLQLIKTSTRGDKIYRSNPSQGVIEVGLNHIIWASAIELGLSSSESCENRFIQLELQPLEEGSSSKLEVPDNDELKDLGLKIMVAAISNWKRVIELHRRIKKHSFGSHDRRLVEIYSVPVCMLSAIYGESLEDAIGRVEKAMLLRSEQTLNVKKDEDSLIDEILSTDIRTELNKNRTVGQMLHDIISQHDPGFDFDQDKAALERCGIKAIPHVLTSKAKVFIHPGTVTKKILNGSKRDIKRILSRTPGAVSENVREYINGRLQRGLYLPAKQVLSFDENEATNEEESENLFSDDDI